MRHSRPACYAFLVFLFRCWGGDTLVHATQVNVTIDDTDASILYTPSASWHSSSVPCSFCLSPDPNLAYQKTYHDGTHIVPTVDSDDDIPSTTLFQVARPSASSAPTQQAQNNDNDNDLDDDKGGGRGNGGPRLRFRKRDDVNPFFTDKLDADDANFIDTPVSLQLRFNGSAVYLYCLMPQAIAMPNQTPTAMNLTFTLDGRSMAPFIHSGSLSELTYIPNVNVFTATGLDDAAHSLRVDIGPDSVFLFDYMVYTQSAAQAVSQSTTAPEVQLTASSATSSEEDESHKQHNIATFAGAVGGSVGVLGILSLGIAISLIRRRRAAARRDRRDRESSSLHTNGSEDSPPMQGPAPFVPRYFPGTVPVAPPPYVPRTPSLSSSSDHSHPMSMVPESLAASTYVAHPPSLSNAAPSMTTAATYTPLLSSLALSSQSGAHALTYADLPPATPPPEDGTVLPVPPPSFGEAIATSLPTLELLPPGIPTRHQDASGPILPSSPIRPSIQLSDADLDPPAPLPDSSQSHPCPSLLLRPPSPSQPPTPPSPDEHSSSRASSSENPSTS